MKTEETIIDGVNVAGCEFCKPSPLYKIEYSCHCRGYIQDDGLHVHLSCEHNPNCYYKQLKRLEQDSKQLTQWLDEARRNADFWCDKCTSLEQENKELKEANKKICEDWEEVIEGYWDAFKEIREILNSECGIISNAKAVGIINEVLNV